jgi:hypothetical protein
MYAQVIRHELSDDGDWFVIHFNVMIKRPSDQKEVKGGGFIIFATAEESTKYSLGKKFVLQDINDIIRKEN